MFHPRILAVYLNGAARLRKRIAIPAAERAVKGDYLTVADLKRLAFQDALKARALRLGGRHG